LLPVADPKEVEVLRGEGPLMVDSAKAISEEDKMILNCLDHVSRMEVCCLIT
jgi:hypothetical protein